MEIFIKTVQTNHVPKVFINQSKFVVICGQKLVFIGSTMGRNVRSQQLKVELTKVTSDLCESLKRMVLSTKRAAMNFPQNSSVQQMLDSAREVQQSANILKTRVELNSQ